MQTTVSTLTPEQTAFLAYAQNSTRRLRRIEEFRVRRPAAAEIVFFRTKHERELQARRRQEEEIRRLEADLYGEDDDSFYEDYRHEDDYHPMDAWAYEGRQLADATEVLDEDFDCDVCQMCGAFYTSPHRKEAEWKSSPYRGTGIMPQRCVPCWDI